MRAIVKVAVLLIVLGLVFSTSALAAGPAGAETFKAKCAMCHGADGSGNTAMGKKLGLKDLGSPEVQKMTDAELDAIIFKGKPPKMPPYGTKLSKEEIKDLVTFVRSLKK